MGLSTLFGRNVSTRERPPSGLKHVRHTGRAQRLSFGKQLSTFMCFTTEEKLSQGGGSGDKRRRKRGSLSQRLRLTESAEDQSCSSPLEALSGLVLRPSTCPPEPPDPPSGVTEAELEPPLEALSGLVRRPSTCPPDPPSGVTDAELEPPPAHSELSDSTLRHRPSSFTLSSLNEKQLNAYLKVMFNRCAKEEESRAALQKTSQDVSDAMVSSGEQLESAVPFADSVTSAENVDPAASKTTVGDKRNRRPTLRECEELIGRHEELFGPIVTSRPAPLQASAPLSHWLPQPVTALPEPCLPPEPDTTYLSIPQHGEAAPCEPEWDAWRHHFSSGPAGVWRIVTHEPAGTEEAAETAPSADARPRRLFGALWDKCSALFRHEQKTGAPDTTPVGDTVVESDTTGAKGEECTEDFVEKTLSVTKADDVLHDMNEEEVMPCSTHGQDLCPVPRQPRHDPEVYRDRAFHHWRRFFRWSGAERPTSDVSSLDESWATITGASEIPLS